MTENAVSEARSTPPKPLRKTIRPKAAPPSAATTSKVSKAAAVIELLTRPEGATIETLTNATGWQAHSVRGFLSGTVKKKLGKPVTSAKTDAGRVYRILEASAA